MPQPLTALGHHTRIDPLPAEQAASLRQALGGPGAAGDVSVFVDGTSFRLPDAALAAVQDVLRRLAQGDGVELASAQSWLNTSQAARLAGISQTYLRNLTDAGEIPVTYRGSHRRFLSADVLAWVKRRDASRAASASGQAEQASMPDDAR